MDNSMKTIKVSAAIIKREHSVFATQRGYGAQKGKWEFPGGKIEPGDYPDFHLQMYCFLCEICERKAGRPVLREHEAARWLTRETIDEVDWLPADQVVLHRVKEFMV